MLLDEPVSGLDPKVTQELYTLIKKLNEEEGITIIMISHDVNSAIKYANKVLHVSHNPFFGTIDEYMNKNIEGKFVGGTK